MLKNQKIVRHISPALVKSPTRFEKCNFPSTGEIPKCWEPLDYPVLTWSRGGPRYNKRVYLKIKTKKHVKKWDFQHIKGGLFCNMKEQLMREGISPKPKITLL